MNRAKQLIIAGLSLALGACASLPQEPIAFDAGAISGGANRVAIQMESIPATDTTFPGAACLLCIGVARVAHTDLSTQVQSLKPEDLEALPARLAEVLRANGAQVTVLDKPVMIDDLSSNPDDSEDPKSTDKDFRPLADRLGADKLLVITIHGQGVLRPYSSYVPTDVPKAYVSGNGYMVDLKRNAYDWYSPLHVSKPADGPWNEPPSFPGLTNAYYQVVAETADSVVNALSANAAKPDGKTLAGADATAPR